MLHSNQNRTTTTTTTRSRRGRGRGRGRALAGSAAIATGLVMVGAPALNAPAQAASHHRHNVSEAKVARIAMHQKGSPYKYGADGPNAFDCSGLTQYAYKKAGAKLPRTSSAQYHAVRHIGRKAAHRGDLVFFRHGSDVYHVGILAKKGKVIHAPHPGAKVRTEKIWTKDVRYGRA